MSQRPSTPELRGVQYIARVFVESAIRIAHDVTHALHSAIRYRLWVIWPAVDLCWQYQYPELIFIINGISCGWEGKVQVE